MPQFNTFEHLPVWQQAAQLYNKVVEFVEFNRASLSAGFRGQLDRAALSVSSNIAVGFERVSTTEFTSLFGIARGSAGEVRSMVAVVRNRPELRPATRALDEIQELAQSCARQLTALTCSVDGSTFRDVRHLMTVGGQEQELSREAAEVRAHFLRHLGPTHPLFSSIEARQARGELTEG
jgi:four helix bundle protein